VLAHKSERLPKQRLVPTDGIFDQWCYIHEELAERRHSLSKDGGSPNLVIGRRGHQSKESRDGRGDTLGKCYYESLPSAPGGLKLYSLTGESCEGTIP